MTPRPADLTRGSVSRALLGLAFPLMGAMFLETAFNIVNAIWVGFAGTSSFAAVNLASFPLWLMFALSGIVTTGTNAVVAQRLGASRERPGEAEAARRTAALGIAVAVLFGVVQSVAVLLVGRRLLAAMAGGGPGMAEVVDLASGYLAFLFLFAPVHSANEAISSVLRAYGDTRTPTLVYTVGFALNFLLDPFLILGLGPFPRLGILGAAIATNASFWAVLVLYTVLLARGRLVYRLPEARPRKVDVEALRRIVAIGLPSSASAVVFCVVFMMLAPIIGHFGEEALAALGIGHRLEGLSYLVCYGFSLAAVTLVGQNVGAGRHDRAERAAWTATAVVTGFTAAVSLVFWFLPGPLASLFTTDPAVRAIAVQYLRVIALSQVFMGVSIVLDGAFAGAGHTIPPMLVSVPAALLRVPAARWTAITMGYGISAVWWCITVLTVIRGLLVTLLFRSGAWKGATREPLGLEPQLEEVPPGLHPLEPGRGEPGMLAP